MIPAFMPARALHVTGLAGIFILIASWQSMAGSLLSNEWLGRDSCQGLSALSHLVSDSTSSNPRIHVEEDYIDVVRMQQTTSDKSDSIEKTINANLWHLNASYRKPLLYGGVEVGIRGLGLNLSGITGLAEVPTFGIAHQVVEGSVSAWQNYNFFGLGASASFPIHLEQENTRPNYRPSNLAILGRANLGRFSLNLGYGHEWKTPFQFTAEVLNKTVQISVMPTINNIFSSVGFQLGAFQFELNDTYSMLRADSSSDASGFGAFLEAPTNCLNTRLNYGGHVPLFVYYSDFQNYINLKGYYYGSSFLALDTMGQVFREIGIGINNWKGWSLSAFYANYSIESDYGYGEPFPFNTWSGLLGMHYRLDLLKGEWLEWGGQVSKQIKIYQNHELRLTLKASNIEWSDTASYRERKMAMFVVPYYTEPIGANLLVVDKALFCMGLDYRLRLTQIGILAGVKQYIPVDKSWSISGNKKPAT